MKRADKLNKMKMPAKPMAEQEAGADMDMAMADMPMEDEAAMEGEPMDQEMAEAGAGDMLADISDDDLMAEIKKRGLQMPAGEEPEAEDEDMEA